MSSKPDPRSDARRNRWLLWGGIAAVVVIAVVVAVAVSGGGSDQAEAKATKYETAPVRVDGAALPRYDARYSGTDDDPAIGETIPTVHGVSIHDGETVTIEPSAKPQAIVFVAHWCPHCQAEVPRIVTLAEDSVFDGVEVIAVATGTSSEAPNYPPSVWLKDKGWPFAVMADNAAGTAAQAFGISAYPYFVLVNADGTVAGRATGEVTPEQITANIEALKAGKPLPLLTSGSSSAA